MKEPKPREKREFNAKKAVDAFYRGSRKRLPRFKRVDSEGVDISRIDMTKHVFMHRKGRVD